MGSETTLPYSLLLRRFNNTLADPVTWWCRCLYDLLASKIPRKSAQQCYNITKSYEITNACLLSLMLRYKTVKYCYSNKSKCKNWKLCIIMFINFFIKTTKNKKTKNMCSVFCFCNLYKKRKKKKKKKTLNTHFRKKIITRTY